MNGNEIEEQSHDEPEMGAEETTAQVDNGNAEVPSLDAVETVEDFENNAARLLDEMEANGGENPGGDDDVEGDDAVNEATEDEYSSEEPEQSLAARYRVRASNEVDARALQLKKANPDMELTDCLEKARAELAPGEEDDEVGEVEEPEPMETSESVRLQIEDLNEQALEAADEMDFRRQQELNRQIMQLQRKEFELTIQERQSAESAEDAQRREFENIENESMARAVQYYPDTTNANSALSQEMVRLDNELRELDDPLCYSAEKPMKLAQMAASRLGIAPSRGNVPKPRQAKSAPFMSPAAGGSGTNTGNQASRLDQALAKVQTIEDYEELVASLS